MTSTVPLTRRPAKNINMAGRFASPAEPLAAFRPSGSPAAGRLSTSQSIDALRNATFTALRTWSVFKSDVSSWRDLSSGATFPCSPTRTFFLCRIPLREFIHKVLQMFHTQTHHWMMIKRVAELLSPVTHSYKRTIFHYVSLFILKHIKRPSHLGRRLSV